MPHFEIYASDVAAAKAFYGGLFDWQFDAMPGGEAVQYHLVRGAGIGGDHAFTAGLLQRPDTAHAEGSAVRGGTLTVEVADCDAAYAWALAHGGGEALPPEDYPGIGRCAYVEDGHGNIVGMITPTKGDA